MVSRVTPWTSPGRWVPHTGREVSPKSPRQPGVNSVFRTAGTARPGWSTAAGSNAADRSQGRTLGLFLRALHRADTDEAVRRGVPPGREVLRERAALTDDFRARVLPLLPSDRHEAASGLLKAVSTLPAGALVHGDLGLGRLLARDGVLTGVIDFGDTHIGDHAVDLAWAWYEVTHGLDTGDQYAVRSGLDGVLDRLPGIRSL
ncbi:phosphotransferase [Streptomyces afghaniensis]|uniref:phosphotransferase n=1 Tax=Streptomyces afghaniensis TaxID=66865 RepID=UPI0037B4D5D3